MKTSWSLNELFFSQLKIVSMKSALIKIFRGMKVFFAIITMVLYLLVSLVSIMIAGPACLAIFGFCIWWGITIAALTSSLGVSPDIVLVVALIEIFLHVLVIALPVYLYGEKILIFWGGLYYLIGEFID